MNSWIRRWILLAGWLCASAAVHALTPSQAYEIAVGDSDARIQAMGKALESGDAAEIDHGARVGPAWARRMSLWIDRAARVHAELRMACAMAQQHARRHIRAVSGKLGADGPLRNGETPWFVLSCC